MYNGMPCAMALAAMSGHVEVITELLRHGADVTAARSATLGGLSVSVAWPAA